MPEPDYELLADAIFRQEGGNKTAHPYGVKSIKPKDKADARRIAINTARNNYQRWNAAGQPGDYLNFLADRYVPASTDPQGNINWKSNVAKIYAQLEAKKKPAEPAVQPRSILMEPLPPVSFPMFPQYPLLAR